MSSIQICKVGMWHSAQWSQRLPRCTTMQCHSAMCSTCSVQSAGHEHHRDAESQVERRRLWHGAIRGIERPGSVTCVFQWTCSGLSKGFLLCAQHLSKYEHVKICVNELGRRLGNPIADDEEDKKKKKKKRPPLALALPQWIHRTMSLQGNGLACERSPTKETWWT